MNCLSEFLKLNNSYDYTANKIFGTNPIIVKKSISNSNEGEKNEIKAWVFAKSTIIKVILWTALCHLKIPWKYQSDDEFNWNENSKKRYFKDIDSKKEMVHQENSVIQYCCRGNCTARYTVSVN